MKGNAKNIYLLGGGAVLLLVLCALSIYGPIRFDRERAARELAVKRRLVAIRHAAEQYRRLHAVYTSSLDTLVAARLLPDSSTFIPYADGKRFELETTTVIGKSGRELPLMECRAAYADFLQGLDAHAVAEVVDRANATGQYPGLKIGSLLEPNDNAGNWE